MKSSIVEALSNKLLLKRMMKHFLRQIVIWC